MMLRRSPKTKKRELSKDKKKSPSPNRKKDRKDKEEDNVDKRMTESVKDDPVLFTPGTQKRVMHTSKIAKNMNRFKAREEHNKSGNNMSIDDQAE